MAWMGLVGNLAGPAIVLVIFLCLRRQIAEVVLHLRRLQGPGGWSAEFDDKAAVVEEHSELVTKGVTKGSVPSPSTALRASQQVDWVESLASLADLSPRGAVIQAYSHLEKEVVRLAEPYGQPRSVTGGARRLAEAEVIPSSMASLIRELAKLRNDATHAPESNLSAEGAKSFVDAAANVVRALQALPTPPPPRHDAVTNPS